MFKTAYGKKERVSFVCTGESRTKQEFKNECDINNIMKKYAKTGMINHVNRYQGQYGDFMSAVDYREATASLLAAEEAFMSLPAKVRSKFENDPEAFLAFVQDPKNHDEMVDLGLLGPNVHKKSIPTIEEAKAKVAANTGEKPAAPDPT